MSDAPLPLPAFTSWPTFPFEGDLRVKPLEDPAEVEPPRHGEDPAECSACRAPDSAYIWVSERWRVRALDRPTGLPMVLILESRSHLDLGDLPNLLAAELGVLTVRLERAVRSLDGVARVHVNRWGDGSAHLHVWFLARPFGRLQLRGTFLSLWDDILPRIPEPIWRENLALVAEWLAEFGGKALAEPPHIDWQTPVNFSTPAGGEPAEAGGDEELAHGAVVSDGAGQLESVDDAEASGDLRTGSPAAGRAEAGSAEGRGPAADGPGTGGSATAGHGTGVSGTGGSGAGVIADGASGSSTRFADLGGASYATAETVATAAFAEYADPALGATADGVNDGASTVTVPHPGATASGGFADASVAGRPQSLSGARTALTTADLDATDWPQMGVFDDSLGATAHLGSSGASVLAVASPENGSTANGLDDEAVATGAVSRESSDPFAATSDPLAAGSDLFVAGSAPGGSRQDAAQADAAREDAPRDAVAETAADVTNADVNEQPESTVDTPPAEASEGRRAGRFRGRRGRRNPR